MAASAISALSTSRGPGRLKKALPSATWTRPLLTAGVAESRSTSAGISRRVCGILNPQGITRSTSGAASRIRSHSVCAVGTPSRPSTGSPPAIRIRPARGGRSRADLLEPRSQGRHRFDASLAHAGRLRDAQDVPQDVLETKGREGDDFHIPAEQLARGGFHLLEGDGANGAGVLRQDQVRPQRAELLLVDPVDG